MDNLINKNIDNKIPKSNKSYKLKDPVKVNKVQRVEIVVDGDGNEYPVTKQNYLVEFCNGFTLEFEEETFKQIFILESL